MAVARALLLPGALALTAVVVESQPIARSQRGSVSQRIASTTVSIEYGRPSARDRSLFGGIVPWGKPWNPGADTATTISFSTTVRLNGSAVAAGTYSLWAIPGEQQWVLILSRAHPVYHEPYPVGRDVRRLTIAPRTGSHMETLAFYFPVVNERRAELVLHWGTLVAPLTIDVP